LEDLGDADAWRIVTYEKGAWILQMLRERMGDDAFEKMLKHMASEYAGRTVSNEEFRKLASSYLPAGGPDPKLDEFFESWVYGTGVPKLSLNAEQGGKGKSGNKDVEIEVGGVAQDFTMDIPITVTPRTGKAEVRWVRCTADGGSLQIPRDATAQLPAPEEFLYIR
jgi:aminopeptidase N